MLVPLLCLALPLPSPAQDIPRTLWPEEMGRREINPRTYAAGHPPGGPLGVTVLRAVSAPRSIDRGRIAVLVESALSDALETSLNTFVDDLLLDGHSVRLESMEGGTDTELRAHLGELYADDLVGVVMVGDLPIAWYEVENDYQEYGYAVFPCDLYYMDLDGDFGDVDGNGVWDSHLTQAGGDSKPEIWVGQLRVTPTMGDAGEVLTGYFDRNHRYRRGELVTNGTALVYVDDDWSPWADYYEWELAGAFEDVTVVSEPNVTCAVDYVPYLEQGFDNVAVYVHSSPDSHFFVENGQYDLMMYGDVPPASDALFYNLFACSNANYADYVYMAGVYALTTERGLIALGSTKTGSMLGADVYYGPLRQYQSFGDAFLEWWAVHWPYDGSFLYWHYGMTMVGDPSLRLGYPTLGVSPGEVIADTRDLEPVEVELAVENVGRDSLQWQVSGQQPWIVADPASGEGAGEVVIALDPAGLEEGYHTGEVWFEAPGATNNPVVLPVDFGVLQPAQVCVEPDPVEVVVDRGEAIAGATVRVSNCRLGRMAWTAEVDVDWIELSASEGETRDDAEEIVLSLDTEGLDLGAASATLTLDSPDAEEATRVDVVLADGGCGACATGIRTSAPILWLLVAAVGWRCRRFVKIR